MGTPRVRRSESIGVYDNTWKLWGNGVVQSSATDHLDLWNFGYCRDELNEMSLLGKSSFDIGGSFTSIQARMDFPPASSYAGSNAFGLLWEHRGPIIAYPTYAPTAWVPESWWSAESLLDGVLTRVGLGATAINRSRPAQPKASLAVALAEMYREGIPHTLSQLTHLKDEVSHFRDLSRSTNFKRAVSRTTDGKKTKTVPSKYLEYQFGWKPLVSDIRKTARALLQQEAILEDLRRNSGKRMRRRYNFPTDSTTTLLVSDATRPWPNPNAYVLQQAGGRTVHMTDTKRTWFAGEFVYTYPGVDAGIPRQMIAGARQLLGLDLSPETVWNIAPWTWLADWFANVGDVVSNFTAIGLDNLVLRYGYLMQEVERVYLHQHFGVTVELGKIPSTVSGRAVYTAKSRIVATPYGFGLTTTDLDPRQLAILAAIGITRNGGH